MVKLLFIFASLYLLVGCEKTIQSGEFQSLTIGDSKQQVLDALVKNKNVNNIRPAVGTRVKITYGKLQNVTDLIGDDGICLRGDRYNMKIYLDDGFVSDIYLSPVSGKNAYGLKKGSTQEEVLTVIKDVISQKRHYSAFNFVANSRWANLGYLSQKDRDFLYEYNAWVYHKNGEHSSTKLYFEKGMLNKILYKWSSFELP